MKELSLTVEKRDRIGTGHTRRLRKAGDIPAIVYGPETEPIPVKVNYRTLYRLMHGTPLNTIINLEIDGDNGKERKVLIRNLQKDPVTGDLLHLDFLHIPLDKPITLTIPVKTMGTPTGVKDMGGIVEHILREVTISCKPTAIPGEIEIDISPLSIGESIHVSDLELEEAKILTDPRRTIVTVVAPTVVKAAAEEAEEEEAEEGEEVEGEEGEKKAESEESEEREGKDKGEEKK
jgi:large subunit ribosomal protein L25